MRRHGVAKSCGGVWFNEKIHVDLVLSKCVIQTSDLLSDKKNVMLYSHLIQSDIKLVKKMLSSEPSLCIKSVLATYPACVNRMPWVLCVLRNRGLMDFGKLRETSVKIDKDRK